MFGFIPIEINKDYQANLFCEPIFSNNEFHTKTIEIKKMDATATERSNSFAILQLVRCIKQFLVGYLSQLIRKGSRIQMTVL